MAVLFKKRRKLYYDVELALASGLSGDPPTATSARNFTVTQVTSVTPVRGDRYGAVLEDLPALTGSSTPELKRRNGVAAWFQPAAVLGGSLPAFGTTVFFIGGTGPAVTPISFLTVGGGAIAVKLGQDAVYSRQIGVRMLLFRDVTTGPTPFSVRGVLHVQRQHSIEV